MRGAISFALALVSIAACGGSGGSDLGGLADSGMRCRPGDTADCPCLGGGTGIETCRANGQGYGGCAGCGPEEADGPLPTIQDGGSACGDCDGCCDGNACVPYASQLNT